MAYSLALWDRAASEKWRTTELPIPQRAQCPLRMVSGHIALSFMSAFPPKRTLHWSLAHTRQHLPLKGETLLRVR